MTTLAYTDSAVAEEAATSILATTLSEADLNRLLAQLGGGRSTLRGRTSCSWRRARCSWATICW